VCAADNLPFIAKKINIEGVSLNKRPSPQLQLYLGQNRVLKRGYDSQILAVQSTATPHSAIGHEI
jgi:hypothetical protein